MAKKSEVDKQNLNVVKLLSWILEESDEYLTPKGKGLIEGFILAGKSRGSRF